MLRDRVKSLRRVPAGKLKPHPKNWRQHPVEQRTALRAAVDEIGFADVILARELPDKSLQILDGHLRAEEHADEKLPVLVLDLDDREADILLATLDPLAGLAQTNAAKLEELLDQLEPQQEQLQQLLNKLAEDAGIEVAHFEPSDDEQPRLDETDPKFLTCPKCGHQFEM